MLWSVSKWLAFAHPPRFEARQGPNVSDVLQWELQTFETRLGLQLGGLYDPLTEISIHHLQSP